ncbi:MAG: substrate-binding domain-containing protein [Verrucomicrobia bacterium]|nr:substrate-binding domain-containing protein [Verrucomicrobiota bacterium]
MTNHSTVLRKTDQGAAGGCRPEEPLYLRVVNCVEDRFRRGDFGHNGRLYSIAELKRIFGVSAMTAVRAMGELKQRGVIRSIKGKGSFFCRTPRPEIRRSTSMRMRKVTVLSTSPDFFRSGFQMEICQGIEEEAVKRQLRLRTEYLPEDNLPGVGTASLTMEPDEGLVMIGANFNRTMVDLLWQMMGRAALVDAIISSATCVATDNLDGMRQLIDHLRKLGHRRVILGFAHPQSPNPTNENERSAAFGFLVRDRGLDGLMLRAEDHRSILERIQARNGATAVLFTQDDPALEFMVKARHAGLRVPEDVSVTGFDGFSAQAKASQLTTLEINRREMGRLAVRAIADQARVMGAVTPWRRVPGCLRKGASAAPPKRKNG